MSERAWAVEGIDHLFVVAALAPGPTMVSVEDPDGIPLMLVEWGKPPG